MALLIEYAEGPVGLLSYSWEVASPLKGVRFSRIYGREGSIAFESNGLLLATSGRRWSVQIPGISDLQGYKAMFADFLRAWRERSEAQDDPGPRPAGRRDHRRSLPLGRRGGNLIRAAETP